MGFWLLKSGGDAKSRNDYEAPTRYKTLQCLRFRVSIFDLLKVVSDRTNSPMDRAILVTVREVSNGETGEWSNGIYTNYSDIKDYQNNYLNRLSSAFQEDLDCPDAVTTPNPGSGSSGSGSSGSTPSVTVTSIFGRPYQNTGSTWYVPVTNSSSEAIPSYSSLQIKYGANDWEDIGASLICGNYGCGAVVSGFISVCPEFRFIARTNGVITTIWQKSASSGGTC